MRKIAIWSLVAALIISTAAPFGAAFALEGDSYFETAEARDDLVAEPDIVISEVEDVPEQQVVSTPEKSELDLLASSPGGQNLGGDDESDAVSPSDNNPPITPTAAKVVIAQIQVGVSGGSASDEYVSLYNNGDEEVDVTGWCLTNKSSIKFACFNEPGLEYVLQPGAYIALSTTLDRPGSKGLTVKFDIRTASGGHIIAGDNVITLLNSRSAAVDAIKWTKNGGYAIERQWDLSQPTKILTGDSAWIWRNSLPHYGYIEAPLECANGSLVYDLTQCAVPPEEINLCKGVVISEIGANLDEQFIEIWNSSEESVSLVCCKLQTNRSSKTYIFSSEALLESGEYRTILIAETDLTLTKTTTGTVYLLSSDGLTELMSVDYKNLTKDTSWSLFDDGWRQTYEVTPGGKNKYEKYAACQDGYWRNLETGRCNKIVELAALVDCGEGRERNPATGRCLNIPTASELAPCREGQYRSEETNRCRSIASAVSSLKPCAEDQFRNPLTNRCKKIASADDVALADCGEGRERNPATNRCRNVLTANMPNVGFAPEKVKQTAEGMAGWWAFGGVSLVALGYAGWQWRFEAGRLVRKIRQAVFSGKSE